MPLRQAAHKNKFRSFYLNKPVITDNQAQLIFQVALLATCDFYGCVSMCMHIPTAGGGGGYTFLISSLTSMLSELTMVKIFVTLTFFKQALEEMRKGWSFHSFFFQAYHQENIYRNHNLLSHCDCSTVTNLHNRVSEKCKMLSHLHAHFPKDWMKIKWGSIWMTTSRRPL